MAAKLDIIIDLQDRASKGIKTLRGKLSKLGGVAGKVLKAGMLAGGAAIAGAGVLAFKFGSDFQEAANIIRNGTGASGEALEGLQDDFRRVFESIPTSMEKAAGAVADWNTLMGLTGEIGQEAAKRSLEAARLLGEDSAALIEAGGQAFNVFEVAGKDVPGMLDKVFRASQATGVPMTQLLATVQTYGPVLKNLGFGFGETTALFGSLEKAGIDVSRVMPGINSFMRNLADQGVTDLKGGLFDVIEQIEGATTSAGALNIATEAFGAEGAQRMSVAIRNGTLDIEDLVGQMGSAEGSILDTAAASETWKEKLTLLKNKVLVKLEPLLVGFVEQVGKLADWISNKLVPALEEWWNEHGPKIVEFFKKVGDKVKDFRDAVVPVFERALEAIRPLGDWFVHNKQAITAAAIFIGAILVGMFTAWAISAGIAAVATIAAAAPILALLLAVALLAAGIYLLVTNFDEIKDKVVETVLGLKDKVVETFNSVIEWVKDNWPLLLAILTGPFGLAVLAIITKKDEILGVVTGLKDKIVEIFNAVKTKVGEIVGGIKDTAVEKFNALITFLEGLPAKFTTMGSNIGNALADAVKDGINSLITFFERGLNNIIGKWNSLEFKVPKVDLGPLGSIGGGTFGVPDIPLISIPRLQKGGEVLRTGLAVVHRGETFSGVGGGTTINVASGATLFSVDVEGDLSDPVARRRFGRNVLRALREAS